MNKKIKGGTYIETLVAFTILLIVLNPIFFSLISLKRQVNSLKEEELLENEIEKVRAFYKKTKGNGKYIPDNLNYEIEIEKKLIYPNLYSLNIVIEKNKKRRESKLYVYR